MFFALSVKPYRKNTGHRKGCAPWKKRKAAEMRKNPTLGEAMVWEVISNKRTGLRFRRQARLFGWIVDFFAPSVGLVVEVDGSSHSSPEAKAYDAHRDAVMLAAGISILRLTNGEAIRRQSDVVWAVRASRDRILRRNSRASLGL